MHTHTGTEGETEKWGGLDQQLLAWALLASNTTALKIGNTTPTAPYNGTPQQSSLRRTPYKCLTWRGGLPLYARPPPAFKRNDGVGAQRCCTHVL